MRWGYLCSGLKSWSCCSSSGRSRLDRKRLLLVDALSITFLLALTWSGLAFMQRGGISLSPSLGLPRSWFYASIPLGAVLSVLALAGRMAKPTRARSDHNAHAAVAHD
jgi:TRAP-type C4-dicarboxylate transport system permease small subunit